MKTISQLLKEKGQDIWWTSPDSKVYDALALMAEKDVGALLVVESEKLVGIFSERDYARKVILKNKSSKNIAVREIMSSAVISITPTIDCEQALALMTVKRVRHLPVLDNGKIAGVVSIGDLVKVVIDNEKQVNKALNQYILENKGVL
jgi:CBS domain-containing protein